MQLDIFNDSRDVMLRNDVLQALCKCQPAPAQSAWQKLQEEYPDDVHLSALQLLIGALAAFNDRAGKPLVLLPDHAALQRLQDALKEQLTPAAQQQMGPVDARHWLRPFWQELVARGANLPFSARCEGQHVAPMLLHLQDWAGAIDAVGRIASWRRIPAPLAWMAQAKLHELGLNSSWPLLVELAWLSPKRLEVLIQTAQNAPLQRLKDQFDAGFEPGDEAPDGSQDLAWFPAWVLTQRAQDVGHLSAADPGQQRAPEQAFRLLVNLLGLERQGRHHDVVAHRKQLRDLNAWLYGVYMQTR